MHIVRVKHALTVSTCPSRQNNQISTLLLARTHTRTKRRKKRTDMYHSAQTTTGVPSKNNNGITHKWRGKQVNDDGKEKCGSFTPYCRATVASKDPYGSNKGLAHSDSVQTAQFASTNRTQKCNLGAFCPAAHSSPPWYQCSAFYAQFRFLHRPHTSATFARPSRSILNYRIVKGSAGADSPIKIIIIIIIKTCSAVPRCCSCLHADAWGLTCRQNLTAYHPVAELALLPIELR